jgi:chemotaxis protein MotB
MKQLSYLSMTLLFLGCLNSCVGTKKYKALQAEKEKITATLLTTKEELSVAKRNLNKLEDRSSSDQEELDASIEALQIRLTESQAKLQASQTQNERLREAQTAQSKKCNEQKKRYEAQLKPIRDAKNTLQKEQAQLVQLYRDLEEILVEDSLVQMSNQLEQGRLVVRLEQAYFLSSEHAVSSAGRKVLQRIAQVAQEHPTVYLDVLGHMPANSDLLGSWKSSTRKPLVILYGLLREGLAPKRVRIVAYSQYAPLLAGNSREAAARNARTELVFHYKAERFIPTLVRP